MKKALKICICTIKLRNNSKVSYYIAISNDLVLRKPKAKNIQIPLKTADDF